MPEHRQLQLSGQLLHYQLLRRPRRSIGLVIRPEGLAVSAPRWVSLSAIESALQDKASWILGKLAQQQARPQTVVLDWQDGMLLPYCGTPWQLHYDHGRIAAGVGLRAHQAAIVLETLEQPRLSLAAGAADRRPEGWPRVVVWPWFRQRAAELLAQRLSHWAPVLGVSWSQLALSNARGRWGSARCDGSIRLNWRLLHLPLELIDYVVVHELCHLLEMNHSPRFWAHVARVMPDYLQRRQALKASQVPDWG